MENTDSGTDAGAAPKSKTTHTNDMAFFSGMLDLLTKTRQQWLRDEAKEEERESSTVSVTHGVLDTKQMKLEHVDVSWSWSTTTERFPFMNYFNQGKEAEDVRSRPVSTKSSTSNISASATENEEDDGGLSISQRRLQETQVHAQVQQGVGRTEL